MEEIRTTRGADEIAALNTATQAAVGSLTGRILHLEAQGRAHGQQLEAQMQQFHAQQTLIVQLLQQLPNRVGSNVVQNSPAPPVPPGAPHCIVIVLFPHLSNLLLISRLGMKRKNMRLHLLKPSPFTAKGNARR